MKPTGSFTFQPYFVLAAKTREFYETNIMIVPDVNFIKHYLSRIPFNQECYFTYGYNLSSGGLGTDTMLISCYMDD